MAKTNPTSIRFDVEKFDFIKESEKLGTAQKVVDFLLDKYWWETKTVKTTQMPPNGFDSATISKNVKDEPPKFIVPKISEYEAYSEELKNAVSVEQIKGISRAAKADSMLTPAEKVKIEQLAIYYSRNLDF
jgi:hypothetical protein